MAANSPKDTMVPPSPTKQCQKLSRTTQPLKNDDDMMMMMMIIVMIFLCGWIAEASRMFKSTHFSSHDPVVSVAQQAASFAPWHFTH